MLRGYIAQGVPLEAAFSRARSFSKKLKKRGGVFVPRGLGVGEEGGKEDKAEQENEEKEERGGRRRAREAGSGAGGR